MDVNYMYLWNPAPCVPEQSIRPEYRKCIMAPEIQEAERRGEQRGEQLGILKAKIRFYRKMLSRGASKQEAMDMTDLQEEDLQKAAELKLL